MIALADGVLEETFALLRECGDGKAECVTYWTGPRGESAVTNVIHPVHIATRNSYEVDASWLTQFFAGQRSSATRVLVQVHTHPGPAGHSTTDDRFCLLPVAGFLSVVIPWFASHAVGFEESSLVEMQSDGSWSSRDPDAAFSL